MDVQIRRYRKAAGLTQDELADKLNVTVRSIGSWERGVRTPDVDVLCRASELFDCSLDELCGVEKPVEEVIKKLLSEEEAELLIAYRDAPEQERFAVKAVLGIVVPCEQAQLQKEGAAEAPSNIRPVCAGE